MWDGYRVKSSAVAVSRADVTQLKVRCHGLPIECKFNLRTFDICEISWAHLQRHTCSEQRLPRNDIMASLVACSSLSPRVYQLYTCCATFTLKLCAGLLHYSFDITYLQCPVTNVGI